MRRPVASSQVTFITATIAPILAPLAMNITTDWNWFFSSIAQSSAAIVGIFGAFIITKILNNQSAFSATKSQIQELILEGQKIADDAGGRYFKWYNERTLESAKFRAENFLDEHPEADDETLLREARFSPFLPQSSANEVILTIRSNRAEEARREKEELDWLSNARNLSGFGAAALANGVVRGRKLPSISSFNHEQVTEERESIDAVLRQARHHLRTVSRFLSRVESNPESSGVISCSLVMIAVLFLVGVIYPLSFLPMSVPGQPVLTLDGFWHAVFSLRGILLIVVSLLFLAVLGMFFVMNYGMKYSEEEIQGLRDLCSLGRYSSYFSIYEVNERQLSKKVTGA
ncbi:hypothetical protein [Pandoraea pnomenusa]|nr:hypothetical protein [Pandoraea pnomenusa]